MTLQTVETGRIRKVLGRDGETRPSSPTPWISSVHHEIARAITVPQPVATITADSPTRGRNMPTRNIAASGPSAQLKVRALASMMLRSSGRNISPTARAVHPAPMTTESRRARVSSRSSVISGSHLRKKSTVSTVATELMPESRLDIAAANRAATTSPAAPTGRRWPMKCGKTRSATSACCGSLIPGTISTGFCR